ncbi:hypothetical protein LPJ63_000285 [Coemansia sp. RSA 2711]|nr:hypothetical protein LPJ63_000285 [Coemansia sp. RSA 2711]KAJ1849630.1 hypothetical protein LPJ70_000354 [Coemansia sp. RSA 2708]
MNSALLTLAWIWIQAALAAASSLARLTELGLNDIPSDVIASGVLNSTVVFGYAYESTADAHKIPWDSLTHLVLAFLKVEPSGDVNPASGKVPELVSIAHQKGVKVLGSIGGDGDGSRVLTTALSTNLTRTHLAESLVNATRRYSLDGIDFDLEFPANDQELNNLYAGLLTMRVQQDPGLLLTMTLYSSNGQFGPNVAKTNVKPFSDIVDLGLVMSYDYFGGFSETSAPNSPFYDIPKHPGLSFTSSIAAWVDAGWNPAKLIAGLPFYGRTAIVDTNAPPTSQFMPNLGSAPPGGPVDKIPGVWTWKDLRDPENGALSSAATPREGWQRFWDSSTETPWLLHNVSRTYIGFDDPESLTIKAHHIITRGLAGAAVWTVSYDFRGELGSVLTEYAAACRRIAKLAADAPMSSKTDNSLESYNSEASAGIPSKDATSPSTPRPLDLVQTIQITALVVLLQLLAQFY